MERTVSGEVFTQLVLEIFRVSGMLNNEGDRLTGEFGLTSSRWKILGAVQMSENPLTVPDIARVMGQSRQAVQRLVDVMVKDGLLILMDNPAHKRAKYVVLTSEAERILVLVGGKQAAWANECSLALDEKDLQTALGVLKKISNTLTQE